MKYKWLNKKNNKKLIIFFNGWGMDEIIVKHLESNDYDVLMFYDYNNLDVDLDLNSLNKYIEKYIVAWSMGVMVATNFKIDYINATAINGTLTPIDKDFGINPKIYDLTINGFDEKSCQKFINNMFTEHKNINIKRSFENQKTELIAIKKYSSKDFVKYSKILISDNDKIIPTKSQVKFWGIEPNLKTGHCPFFLFKKWSELL